MGDVELTHGTNILGPDSRPFINPLTEYQGVRDGELVYRRDDVSEDLADSYGEAVREVRDDIAWTVDSDSGPDDDYVSVGCELWERIWNAYQEWKAHKDECPHYNPGE